MNSTTSPAAKFEAEYNDIWRCFYDGTCPTGEQRDWHLAALAKQFPREAALQAAKDDGWKLDRSPGTEMSNETWYRRCPTQSAAREETLIERYSSLPNIADDARRGGSA